ncbi:MAG TPA: hypothetical protein VHC69_19780 [Polyangiaceae bacterium]|nr:hypothetical protein [Polyangiaceae bacterium]
MVAPSAGKRPATPPIVAVVAAAGAVAIVWTYSAHFPVREWLVWRIAGYWALTLYWGTGCAALGMELLERIAPRQYRPLEALVVGFATGVIAFAAAVFAVGLVGGLGKAFFVLAPALFATAGHRALLRWCARVRPSLRDFPPRLSRFELLSLSVGVAGLLAVYVPILTPHNVQHDARWYHLPIAQQFASTGVVAKFPEGWLLGAYPHLASFLYTWAFLLPAGIVHRVELCGHLEFVIFLVTIAAVPALVRRVMPGTRVPLAWVAFFLFPGFLRYDSNLSTGADHVAALFASAGLLVLFAALRTLAVSHALLVGLMAAGALSTKYSAISVAAPLLAFIAARALLYANGTGKYRRASFALLGAAGAFVVAWAPHWLANLLWYGDPVYPMLHDHVTGRPWDMEADLYFRVFMQYAVLAPSHDLKGAFDTLFAAATLGFRAYETGFHGETPVFGFLFAATLYCVPFLRPSWRVRVAYAVGFSAVLIWYWTNHRDRYLQACLPWLVVATLCVLVPLWRSPRRAARASVLALVFAQLACGAGAYLEPSHFMIPGDHPLVQVMALVEKGHKGEYAQRFEPYKEWHFATWTDFGRRLPANARVLVHEDRLWIGLDRPVVVDEAQWQAGIRYGPLTSPAEVYDLLRRFGVTHIVTGENHSDGGDHGISGNLVFSEFVAAYAKRIVKADGLTLWQMPESRPTAATLGPALVLTCNQSQPVGLYPFAAVRARQPNVELSAKDPVPSDLVRRATYVVIEDECGFSLDEDALADFRVLSKRGRVTYYRRANVSDVP